MSVLSQIAAGQGQNFLGGLGAGQSFVENIRRRRDEETRKSALQQVAQAYNRPGEDVTAQIANLAAVSPDDAIKMQSLFDGMDARGIQNYAINLVAAAYLPPEETGALLQKMGAGIPKRAKFKSLHDSLMNATNPEELTGKLYRQIELMQTAGVLEKKTATPAKEAPEEKAKRENLGKIRTEVRKDATKVFNELSKEAAVLETNYKKITGLTKQIEKGNRTAVSQALVSLVKLGDPTSVVKESEMASALNAQNPLAAITDMLQDKGTSENVISSIIKRIDILNPNNININDILTTANELLGANVPSIQNRYKEIDTKAKDNLSDAGYRSVSSKMLTNRIGRLSLLGAKSSGDDIRDISDDELMKIINQ